jgi:hypothetical protein
MEGGEVYRACAYENGTDREFRNVGFQYSNAGKTHKRKHMTYKTRRKLKIKNISKLETMWKKVAVVYF